MCLAWALAGASAIAGSSKKLDPTEQKIRLMAEALQAQDAGDFDRAESRLSALLEISPNDPQLRRMLQGVRDRRDQKAKAPPPVAAPVSAVPSQPELAQPQPSEKTEVVPSPSPGVSQTSGAETQNPQPTVGPPSDPEALLAWEFARQQELQAQSRARLTHGLSLAREERFKEALDDLREADLLLPRNSLMQPLRAEIEAARNDVEHRQRVAGFSQGPARYKLSVSELRDPSAGVRTDGEASYSLDIQVLEMPPDVFADFLVAWAEICREERERSWNSGVVVDHRGRVMFHRPNEPLSTLRQMELFWALKAAELRPASQIQSRSPEGLVGVSGSFATDKVVKALADLEGCRLLGAPRVVAKDGYQTLLSLSEEAAVPAPALQREALGSAPLTGVELRVKPMGKPGAGSLSLWVSPSVVQYEGRVVSGEAAPVYSRHETSATIVVSPGVTALLGGLEREEGRAIAGRETVAQRLPFVGEIIKDRSAAERQREIVVLISLR